MPEPYFYLTATQAKGNAQNPIVMTFGKDFESDQDDRENRGSLSCSDNLGMRFSFFEGGQTAIRSLSAIITFTYGRLEMRSQIPR
jgi:hypothetical protein